VFEAAGRAIPPALADWEERLDGWCAEYRAGPGAAGAGAAADAEIVEVTLGLAVYLFDLSLERVVVAYGLSQPPAKARDAGRMRGFPDVGRSFAARLGTDAPAADKGHFLAHAAGGELDMNLFPQRRDLNRGWSEEGKLYRRMERRIAGRPGTFHFHRPLYGDGSWVPWRLELGMLLDDREWWVERFANR
jgi:hypothetical protein